MEGLSRVHDKRRTGRLPNGSRLFRSRSRLEFCNQKNYMQLNSFKTSCLIFVTERFCQNINIFSSCSSAVTVMKEKFALLTLTGPLRRKLRMRWFFDVSKVKLSSFFKSVLTDPPHLLENTN